MNLLPPSTFRLPQAFGLLLIYKLVPIVLAEPSMDGIAPSQTRLLVAQANPGSAAAVSSQTVATQPEVPQRADEAKPPPLGDTPGLGWLFRNRQQLLRRNELLIFLTPRVVSEATTAADLVGPVTTTPDPRP